MNKNVLVQRIQIVMADKYVRPNQRPASVLVHKFGMKLRNNVNVRAHPNGMPQKRNVNVRIPINVCAEWCAGKTLMFVNANQTRSGLMRNNVANVRPGQHGIRINKNVYEGVGPTLIAGAAKYVRRQPKHVLVKQTKSGVAIINAAFVRPIWFGTIRPDRVCAYTTE